MVRTKLSNLDTYISTIGNDITKFNGYVQMLVQTLNSRGETTNDLITNLFKGYASCSDQNFVKYIARKQEDYEEGVSSDLTATTLMEQADQKYRTLKDKEIWEAPSAEEEKLIALEARFAELKKKMSEKKSKTKKETGTKSDGGKKKKNLKQKPKWMFEEPKPEDLYKPKQWNGKTWYYCGKASGGKCTPGQYRCHKPSMCKGTAAFKRKADTPSDNPTPSKKVVINEALNEIEGGYDSA
jgi:hypothetical protein